MKKSNIMSYREACPRTRNQCSFWNLDNNAKCHYQVQLCGCAYAQCWQDRKKGIIMRIKQLKQKYPDVFKEVYDGVKFEVSEAFAPENIQTKIIERIAHNAAAIAVCACHREIKK